MSDLGNANFSETAASNNATPPDGAPEGMAASGVNDTIREYGAAIKRARNLINPIYTTGGTANAQTITPTTDEAAYYTGQRYMVKLGATNTGAATLKIGGLATKDIKDRYGAALAAGALVSGHYAEFVYNGTNFIYLPSPGRVVQHVYAEVTANGSTSTAIAIDGSNIANSEGVELITLTMSPRAAGNKIRLSFCGDFYHVCGQATRTGVLAMFDGTATNAFRHACFTGQAAVAMHHTVQFEGEFTSVGTASITPSIRIGAPGGDTIEWCDTFFGTASRRITLIATEYAP